jgi:hypothetical protein
MLIWVPVVRCILMCFNQIGADYFGALVVLLFMYAFALCLWMHVIGSVCPKCNYLSVFC